MIPMMLVRSDVMTIAIYAKRPYHEPVLGIIPYRNSQIPLLLYYKKFTSFFFTFIIDFKCVNL